MSAQILFLFYPPLVSLPPFVSPFFPFLFSLCALSYSVILSNPNLVFILILSPSSSSLSPPSFSTYCFSMSSLSTFFFSSTFPILLLPPPLYFVPFLHLFLAPSLRDTFSSILFYFYFPCPFFFSFSFLYSAPFLRFTHTFSISLLSFSWSSNLLFLTVYFLLSSPHL